MQPIIGISSGDPSGIGLEVTLKALPIVAEKARWILYTDSQAFDRHYVRFGDGFPHQWIHTPQEATDISVLYLIEVPDHPVAGRERNARASDLRIGRRERWVN